MANKEALKTSSLRGERPSDAPWWTGSWTLPHRFDGLRREAAYVRARDGIEIATYRYLPANLKASDRIPAILIITPYISETEPTWLGKLIAPKSEQRELAETLARAGYATIFMDGRGSGASFGVRGSDLFAGFTNYACDVVDWIVAQPWSNGKVGSTGVSAVGLASYWLALGQHPAVKAIAPRFTSFDIFYDTHPGGLLTNRFIQDIDAKLKLMDTNQLWKLPDTGLLRTVAWFLVKGICPVDGDNDGSKLRAALAEHGRNGYLSADIAGAKFRDDQVPDATGKTMLDSQSMYRHLQELAASKVAVYLFAGWYDAAFCRAMINAYLNVANPSKKIVIGPWSHGGRQNSSPFVPGKGTRDFDQSQELVRFFDYHLRGEQNGIGEEAPVHYYTIGTETWTPSPQWPPQGTKPLRLYFDADRRLTDKTSAGDGVDTYKVDFSATTGLHSRFGKHLTGDRQRASYPDRRDQDKLLLIYDSPPLNRDLEITGHGHLTLHLTSDCEDGAFLAYLEDVWPDGTVYNITDGVLSAGFRKISTEAPPYINFAHHRTLTRADYAPLVPGRTTELIIDLSPISYVVAKGHRIRIALSGADRDNFPLLPPGRPPTWSVSRGGAQASFIELPTLRAPDAASLFGA